MPLHLDDRSTPGPLGFDNQRYRVAVSEALMKMAAKRSTETTFGWTHPDCIMLQDAARMLIGASIDTDAGRPG
jgi:hypothetical protein